MRIGLLPALLLMASPAVAQPAAESASFNPKAIELFERDWVLMRWAIKQFDGDGDGAISAREAQAAAAAFKQVADGDANGRVTPWEYERAREFIIARY